MSKTFLKSIKDNIRSRLVVGFIAIIPLGLTFFILNFIVHILYGLIRTFLPSVYPFSDRIPESVALLVTLFIILIILYLIGLSASHYAGKAVIAFGEKIFLSIPFVKTIYSAAKKVVTSLSTASNTGFKSVVIIEFPHPGLKVIGFVTGVVRNMQGKEFCKVFVPTSPNPTAGFIEFVPQEKVKKTNISVEEAIQTIVSGGLVSPEIIDL
jgi:uncharacterized membrane protein